MAKGEGPYEEITYVLTFKFPIRDTKGEYLMKNIPLSTLPNFHGLSSADLDSFHFQYDVLCYSYVYVTYASKVNLFPTTLKNIELCCFMGLGGQPINTWDDMKQKFLQKYKDHCKD